MAREMPFSEAVAELFVAFLFYATGWKLVLIL